MGRKDRKARDGQVVATCSGARWIAQLELDELLAGRFSRFRIDVQGRFPTEEAAVQAAQVILTEWRMRGVTLRDLLLRELAALYRRLRARYPMAEPAAVPTTSATWNRAISLWEGAGWLDAADAARYREHVARAFDAAILTVCRRGLVEVEPDVTP